jgi:hypothetical protein
MFFQYSSNQLHWFILAIGRDMLMWKWMSQCYSTFCKAILLLLLIWNNLYCYRGFKPTNNDVGLISPPLISVSPNVVIEWLIFLPRIWDVPDSNLCPETCNQNRGFLLFYSVPPGECRYSTLKLGSVRFLPNPFQSVLKMEMYKFRYNSLNQNKDITN